MVMVWRCGGGGGRVMIKHRERLNQYIRLDLCNRSDDSVRVCHREACPGKSRIGQGRVKVPVDEHEHLLFRLADAQRVQAAMNRRAPSMNDQRGARERSTRSDHVLVAYGGG